MFDEVSCEEYFNEDFIAWLDELEVDFVNGELQVIADEEKAESVSAEWDAFFFELFTNTEHAV